MLLKLLPISLAEANAFVQKHHRHHRPVVGHKFSLAAVQDGKVVGVAIVGRPVSRLRDDGLTLEVTRLCSMGHRTVCSFLYGAAARAAFALGYRRIGTYTLCGCPHNVYISTIVLLIGVPVAKVTPWPGCCSCK